MSFCFLCLPDDFIQRCSTSSIPGTNFTLKKYEFWNRPQRYFLRFCFPPGWWRQSGTPDTLNVTDRKARNMRRYFQSFSTISTFRASQTELPIIKAEFRKILGEIGGFAGLYLQHISGSWSQKAVSNQLYRWYWRVSTMARCRTLHNKNVSTFDSRLQKKKWFVSQPTFPFVRDIPPLSERLLGAFRHS